MEVTMNELNYWFHDHKAKRESYAALQSVELKFTSENGNCDKCSKFQLISTRVYLTYFAFYILLCVPLGFNLSENPRLTTFLKRQARIHLFTVKKIEWSYHESQGRLIGLINCYIVFTTKHLIPEWSMIDTKCVIVCRLIVIIVKHAKSAGCIKSMPLTTWVTCFRCILRFFPSITIHISWEMVFKTSNKYQFPREARRFLRIQQWCL